MEKEMEKEMNTTVESRRDFIKYKVLGGFLFFSGIPLVTAASTFKPSRHGLNNDLSFRKNDQINWKKVRKQFLIDDFRTHFNTASIGPSPKSVVEAQIDMLMEQEQKAIDGRPFIPTPHQKIGKFLNVSSDDIAITRNTTEGMNIIARSVPLKEGDEVILTSHEHIGGSACWLALQKQVGIKIKVIELDLSGKDNLRIIKESVTHKTKVISISHITCTTGLRLPVKDIVGFCRERGIYSVIDGAQAIGSIPVDLKDIDPDFYAASGHKWLFGPKGTGILYINKKVINECNLVFAGAYSDEKFDLNQLKLSPKLIAQREEYGTRNTPVAIGLGAAVDFINDIGIENVEARGREMMDYFKKGFQSFSNTSILSSEIQDFSTTILTVKFNGQDNFKIADKVDKIETIKTRYIYENDLHAIRISFSILNSEKDVDNLLEAFHRYS